MHKHVALIRLTFLCLYEQRSSLVKHAISYRMVNVGDDIKIHEAGLDHDYISTLVGIPNLKLERKVSFRWLCVCFLFRVTRFLVTVSTRF